MGILVLTLAVLVSQNIEMFAHLHKAYQVVAQMIATI